MHPILFDIAGYGVSTFGFFMVAALVLFYYLVAIVSKRFDLSSDIFTSNYIWILLLALVSGRGFYILGQDVE
ncbi:MAG: hypothetical protein U9Q15_05440 [Patescibacteria group bacterium]|nr:hypothetical protein [Patescibacteria group bacterium]